MKKVFLCIFCLFCVIFSFAQSEEIIVLPDIFTELSSGTFQFDEDAIPDFTVEVSEVVEEPVIEEIIVVETVVEEPVEIIVETPIEIEEVPPQKKGWFFKTGGRAEFSKVMLDFVPTFGVEYFGEKFVFGGDLDIALGGSSVYSGDKKQFFAIESLDFMGKFQLPKNLSLTTKLGIELFQSKDMEKTFDFAVPLAVNLEYAKDFWKVYGEVGQKSFRLFDNNFYCGLGGSVDFSYFTNQAEIQLGKKIGFVNTLSFSTNKDKYEVSFIFDYYLKESPCFGLSGIYKF